VQIVFNNTGDTIELEPNKKVFEYYTKHLNDSNTNNFNVAGNDKLPAALTQLSESLTIVNDFFKKHFKLDTFSPFVSQSLIDQEVLNKVHKAWVKIQFQYNDNLVRLLGNIDKTLLQHFIYINSQLHLIEKNFNWQCTNYIAESKIHVEFEDDLAERVCLNKLELDILDFNVWNIRLIFNDQGRQTYSKWKWGDYTPTDIDTSDFIWFVGEIKIDLQRPIVNLAPPEYIKWCKIYNIPVIGTEVGLANIKNWWENLTQVREIFLRNIEKGNTFSLVNM